MTYVYRWIRANASPIYEERQVKRQIGSRKVEKRKGILSSSKELVDEPIYETVTERVPTGKLSDCLIDIDDYAERITKACNQLDADGYDVMKISEVVGGRYSFHASSSADMAGRTQGGYGYGYGYSITDGVVIIGKKRTSPPH